GAAQVAGETAAEMAEGRFVAATSRADALGAAETSAAGLVAGWRAAVQGDGAVRSVGTPAVLSSGPNAVGYEVAILFQHGEAHAQVFVDDKFRVMSLSLWSGPPTKTAGR
ncbi:MAG TPA: hypothetical protein VMU14_11885, partial [Acidimicrobiales bacterium]|nr:hypothetical protein [Acidimicrobiales bacterium]